MTDETTAHGASTSGDPRAEGLDLPATYINRFAVLVAQDLTRISFGEQVVQGLPERYHATFIMTIENAVSLANLILHLVKQNPPTGENKNP